MSTTQTWSINGVTYNHSQLMELKRQGKDPKKDKVPLRTLNAVSTPEPIEEVEPVSTPENVEETLEQEFARLKASRAWLRPETKDRYKELKNLIK